MARKLPPPPPIGAILRQLRLERQLTQEELGHRTQLSMTYISLIETGKRNPTVAAVSRILVVLRVSWTEFGALLDASDR